MRGGIEMRTETGASVDLIGSRGPRGTGRLLRTSEGNAAGTLLLVGSAVKKFAMTGTARAKTVAAEMIGTRMITGKTVMGIGATLEKAPLVGESVGTAIWRIGDGATRGVEADRRAHTEIKVPYGQGSRLIAYSTLTAMERMHVT
jgi:hypothetical protein